ESIGDVIEGRVSLLSEDGLLVGIHRDNAVAVGLHIGGHAVAWPRGLGRKTDHGEGLTLFEDIEDGICHAEPQVEVARASRPLWRRHPFAALRASSALRSGQPLPAPSCTSSALAWA